MGELRALFEVLRIVFKLLHLLLLVVIQAVRLVVRGVRRLLRGAPVEAPPPPPKLAAAPAPKRAADGGQQRKAAERLAAKLAALATRARALDARCADEPLCAPMRPTLRDFVVPEVDRLAGELRHATAPTNLRALASSAAYLDALTQLLERMADQRRDEALAELVDDADTLAEACYRPVVEYCRTNGVPLASDRAATVFGDGCSPWLGRLDDPTGLAMLHLPWTWMAEVHRWPAIGHEVGHDFYDSVAGLDDEVLRRHGLLGYVDDDEVLDGRSGVGMRDIDRIVTTWRRELVADAFGAMMFGPAYAVTTAAIFASPAAPREALTVDVDDSGARYEVHPPGHIRVAAVCRLLARMGHGALGVSLEQRWRAQHGQPSGILLPIPEGWLQIPDEIFLDRIGALTASLYQEGYSALRDIPLASMPGFDFGPREHEAALRARDAFVAGTVPPLADARLLIAGAVLAWAERPADGARVLRAARLAVGKLPLRVAGDASPARAASTPELIRDAFLLDLVLSPPVSARWTRAQYAKR
jgi:hypothetical protein